ncbi:zinc finger, C2H2, Poly(ADP-ribose) polymerase, catalytic domain protein [Artemisia annua]|uniref:Zinc finger, C2H2, Poly(ADP-ribose) polymerase, catalytic domain protein n=1 Tax=Artemisia annua TaxID=35608 RepID=A0A2U1KC19_ARTAN|nr:zinc finger, C2H2, Poly(ADP-ribose) polymerase, catalytic domain protein [Artemisia annua]
MAVLTLPPPETTHKVQPTKRRRKHHSQNPNPNPKPKQQNPTTPPPSSWDQIKNLLKCKQMDVKNNNPNGYSKLSSCSSICNFKDVANGHTTRVVHRADNSPESSTAGQDSSVLRRKKHVSNGVSSSSSSSTTTRSLTNGSVRSNNGHGSYTSASRGMQFRKLSGCYECHAIVDPARHAIPRSTICLCSECGEVFPKKESLEHHQAVRHAVSELGPEDSGRNIVEIIFKSSWQNKNHPIFTIDRILKVNNTRRTIQRFEDCRETVKIQATLASTATRCAADGNELLRFHCTTVTCSLGLNSSSSLCSSVPGCGVCTVIRHGFTGDGGRKGVCTTASSGRAHDALVGVARGVRAMLVCRVIAGKVKRVEGHAPPVEDGCYDSVSGFSGSYSGIEELFVYNPRAILPCFVVIYKAMES